VENFLARVFVLRAEFSSFAGGAKQVLKMRNFSYAFLKLTCKCAKRSGGKNRDKKLWVGLSFFLFKEFYG